MAKNVKKNYIYNVIYQIVVMVVPIIVTPFLSRALTPAGIGQYSFTYSIVSYFILFAGLGFSTHGMRLIATARENRHQQSVIFWEVFLCRLMMVGAVVVIYVSLILGGVFGENTILMWWWLIILISVALDITYLLQGNENFGRLVMINVIIRLVSAVSSILLINSPNDVWLYVLITALGTLLPNLALWLGVGNLLEKVKIKELHPLRHFRQGMILFIPTIAITLYTYLDKILLGVITDGTVQNGYYEQADKIVRILTGIIACLSTVMLPRNTALFAKGDQEKLNQNIYRAMHLTWLISIPMCMGLICVANNFVPWFCGEDYLVTAKLLQIEAVIIVLVGISNVIGMQYLYAVKQEMKYTIAVFCSAVVNLILNIPLIYNYQAVGACVATVVAELVGAIVLLVMVRKQLSFRQLLISLIKPLIAGLVMLAALIGLNSLLVPSALHTFLIVGAGVLIYGITILLLRDKLVLNVLGKILHRPKANIPPAEPTTDQGVENV